MLNRNPVAGYHFGLVLLSPRLFAFHVWTRQYAAVTLCVSAFGRTAYLHVGDPS